MFTLVCIGKFYVWLWSSPPNNEQWARSVYCSKAFEGCILRSKRILSNLTLFNANTVRMHHHVYSCVYSVNSRLMLKIALSLSLSLSIFIFLLFFLSATIEYDLYFSLPPYDSINIHAHKTMSLLLANVYTTLFLSMLNGIPHRLSTLLSPIISIYNMQYVYTYPPSIALLSRPCRTITSLCPLVVQ